MNMSNGKSSSEDDNIKSAADLLLKGGTLLSNSCENCGGVQVRFKENIVCVSCGRKVKEINVSQIEEEKKKKDTSININNNNNNDSSIPSSKEMEVQTNSAASEDDIDGSSNIKLKASKRIIYKKITLLITSIADDNDIFIQNNKLDLISKYLDIFNKLKYINNEDN